MFFICFAEHSKDIFQKYLQTKFKLNRVSQVRGGAACVSPCQREFFTSCTYFILLPVIYAIKFFMSLVFAINKYLHTSSGNVRSIIFFLGCQSNKELSYVDCTIEESFPKHCCFRGLLIHSCLCLGCSRSRICIKLILESVTFCVLNTGTVALKPFFLLFFFLGGGASLNSRSLFLRSHSN